MSRDKEIADVVSDLREESATAPSPQGEETKKETAKMLEELNKLRKEVAELKTVKKSPYKGVTYRVGKVEVTPDNKPV
jgi:hypothetical protein